MGGKKDLYSINKVIKTTSNKKYIKYVYYIFFYAYSIPAKWSKLVCGGGGGRLSIIFILATAPKFDAAMPLPAFARLFMAPDVKSDDKSSTNLCVLIKTNTTQNKGIKTNKQTNRHKNMYKEIQIMIATSKVKNV